MKKHRVENISNAEAIKEITTFSEENPAWSYYDIKAYAIDHNKEDWLQALRDSHSRGIIALYVRENHRRSGIPYINDLTDSIKNASDTEAKYYERHDS